jgi:hypothetical protein
MAARKPAGKTPAKGASKQIRKKRSTASRKRIPRAKTARGPEPAESPLDVSDSSIARQPPGSEGRQEHRRRMQDSFERRSSRRHPAASRRPSRDSRPPVKRLA